MRTFRWSLALTLLAAACSGDDDAPPAGDDDDTPGDDDDDDDVVSFEVRSAVSEHVPSVLHLTATVPMAVDGAASVRATLTPTAGGEPRQVQVDASPGSDVLLPAPGLVQSASYEALVEILDAAGAPLASDTLALTAPPVPAALAGIAGVMTNEPIDAPYIAMALAGADDSGYLVVLDQKAEVVWWLQAAPLHTILTPVLSRDGEALLFGEYHTDRLQDTGVWVRVRLDGTETTTRPIELSHHAAVELPDQSVAWLALDFRDVEVSGGSTRSLTTDRIYVGPEAYEPDPVEVFNTFDDRPGVPELSCEHSMARIDRFDARGVSEWTHGNSLVYSEAEDAYYLFAKYTDWLMKIDASSGELLWQLGGQGSDFTYPDGLPVWTSAYAPTLVSHGHMSQVWEGGMVVFDNGDHRTPAVSSAAELAWNETERTVQRVWEFYHPQGQATVPLGDVKKLDNGDYLVSWGRIGDLMVIAPDKTVRWYATVPSLFTIGRVVPLDHL